MNQNESNNPVPEISEMNELVAGAVKAHRIKIRVLTSASLIFGFLAVAASIVLVWFYFIKYLPPQEQVMRDAKRSVQQTETSAPLDLASMQKEIRRIDKFLGVQITLTYAVSVGVTFAAVAIGVLGLGTLVLLVAVVLNRRATLQQISASLAQISSQFRELQLREGRR